ncbi:MAG: alpha/beta hydrolase [Proteobacteria bacterium]|nr:alpha/beta hydrolase [Pseudomonadota bacterium]
MLAPLLAAAAVSAAPAPKASAPKPVSADALAKSLFLPGQAVDVEHHGKTYRVFVSVPPDPVPPEGFPMLVVLDGNFNFYTAATMALSRARWKEASPLVVVGVGYPTTSADEILARRVNDLTPLVTTDPGVLANRAPGATGGEAAAFRSFLTGALPSIVGSFAKIDGSCTTLFGHSLGGLFVADTLLRAPQTYRQYFASSPSLWNNDFAVLKEEAGFRDKLAALPSPIRVELSVGGLEREFSARQLAGVPSLRALPDVRMVAALTEFGGWMTGLHAPNVTVRYDVVEGESHTSVVPYQLVRAVEMASECPATPPQTGR